MSDNQKEKKERKGKNFQFPDTFRDSVLATLQLWVKKIIFYNEVLITNSIKYFLSILL